MRKVTRILLTAVTAAIVMFAAALTCSAAESGTCGDYLTWTLDDDGTLTISGTGKMTSIPWEDSDIDIVSVEIENGVTSIHASAFSLCSSLESVSIPSSVTSIGTGAFAYCRNLPAITLDENNTSFRVEDGILFDYDMTKLIVYPAGKLGEFYEIPNGITEICDMAFYGCYDFYHISIPESVVSIGNRAFCYCSWLADIVVPEGVVSVGEYAFSNCPRLVKATFSDSIVTIGECAFSNDTLLTCVIIGDGVKTIGTNAFSDCTSLTAIVLPAGITSLGFSNNSWDLSYVYFGGSENEFKALIENMDFLQSFFLEWANVQYNCGEIDEDTWLIDSGSCGDNLTWELYFNGTLTICGSGDMTDWEEETEVEWSNCYKYVSKVVLDDRITSIGSYAFANFDAFSGCDVVIPSGVTSIGKYAFYYCGMKSINIPDGVTIINDSVFRNCVYITELTIPDGVTSIGDYAFSGCRITNIALPEGVTSIGSSAFSSCINLTDIILPDGIQSIEISTFYYCKSLISITIPKSVTSIQRSAFNGCSSLSDVYYTGTAKNWASIDMYSGNYSDLKAVTIHYECVYPRNKTLSAIGKYVNSAEAEVVVTVDGNVTVSVAISDKTKLSSSEIRVFAASYSDEAAEKIEELSKTATSSGAEFTGNVSGSYKIFIWDKNMRPITEDVG